MHDRHLKEFGGVQALGQVDFSVRHGEIHALLGENGAGKSTLLKILCGVVRPDGGFIEIDGKRITEHTRNASRKAGVAMIFQENSLAPALSAAQNIFLDREPRNRFGLIDDRAAIDSARSLFEEFGVDINVSVPVSELGAGQRQLTEIVKAVSQRTRILILDEPTTALSGSEVKRLFAVLTRVKDDGVALIYVSHRMDEITRIADRVTILRDGRRIVTADISDLTVEKMIEYIVGRQSRGFKEISFNEASQATPVLELRNASSGEKLRGIDLVLRRGEVVGVAGLLGSGRSSLARLLFGLEPLAGGEILINGRPAILSNPGDAIAAGIALIPEDRHAQGVIVQHSVTDNICLPILDRISHYSWVSVDGATRIVAEQIARIRIKTESGDTPLNSLSGGSQQKVVLAKWLAMDPAIFVLDEPTAGIDIGSKAEIISLIRELAGQGKSVLLISSELAELLAACDRFVIMAKGRIVRNLLRRSLDSEDAANQESSERLLYAERQLQMAMQGVGLNA